MCLCRQLQMIMSKDIEPTDQLVKSLIDQAHMKFQAINNEQLAKKNARDRAVQENAVRLVLRSSAGKRSKACT